MKLFLKIKLKSLAAESKIIHEQERKHRGSVRDALTRHRRQIVRNEARHTHIAYGYLRGRAYSDIEHTPRMKVDWDRVHAMVRKYGPTELATGQDARKLLETWAGVEAPSLK